MKTTLVVQPLARLHHKTTYEQTLKSTPYNHRDYYFIWINLAPFLAYSLLFFSSYSLIDTPSIVFIGLLAKQNAIKLIDRTGRHF